MIPKEKSKRYLAISLVLIMLAVQIIFMANASLAEYRETKEDHEIENHWETAAFSHYCKENIDKIAQKYNALPEYLYYLAEVEVKFNLAAYELMALIAQESEFRSITHMDGGSLSYNKTQMKLPTAKTAYMAITEYYKMEIPYPTHELLQEDEYYAALLAGGYLRYLHDIYKDKYESYTAYRWGINGRLNYFARNGHFQSPYALRVEDLTKSFADKNI